MGICRGVSAVGGHSLLFILIFPSASPSPFPLFLKYLRGADFPMHPLHPPFNMHPTFVQLTIFMVFVLLGVHELSRSLAEQQSVWSITVISRL